MCLKFDKHSLTQDFLKHSLPSWENMQKETQFESLMGDASNRRYVRVYNNTESYILMIYPQSSDSSSLKIPFSKTSEESVNNDSSSSDERSALNFLDVQKLFQNHKIKVPQVIATDLTLGYILLEDLGNITLEHEYIKNPSSKKSHRLYLKAIDELIKIHQIPIDSTQKASCFHLQFSEDQLFWELNYMKTHLLDQYFKLNLSDSEQESLDTEFRSICKTLSSLPQVICHRDYHSRNIMIYQDQAYIIDFQDARLGPIQYDLVSLFRDSYVNIPENLEDQWIQYYKEQTNLKQSSSFAVPYKMQIIQRGLKACGSFSSFYNQKKETRYLGYLKPTLTKIKKTITELKEYPELEKLFADHIEGYIQ